MWQTHYYIAVQRMRDLEAEAARRRGWTLADGPDGRPVPRDRAPSRARVGAAQVAAGVSRAAARVAIWLDCRVAAEPRGDAALRDA